MSKNTKEIFRENLRKIIHKKGLTLSQAAGDCEISLSFLNQLLSGKKSYSSETIDKLCKGLECTQGDLFAELYKDPSSTDTRPAQPSNADLLTSLYRIAPALNHDELEAVLAFAESLPSALAMSTEALSRLKNDGQD